MKILVALNLNGAHGRQQLAGIIRHWERRHDRSLRIIQSAKDFLRECEEIRKSQAKAGVIIGSPADGKTTVLASKLGVATVFIDIPVPESAAQNLHHSHVRVDNAAIGRLAARYLHDLGNFRSFAYLPHVADSEWSRTRGRAFADELALLKHSLKIFPGGKNQDLIKWIQRLPKPAALFAANDARALQALDAANDANVKVPGQIALLGVDDDELLCEQAKPPLSSIRPDNFQEGVLAAREIDRLLSLRNPTGKTLQCPTVSVTERQSTRTPAPATQLLITARKIISKDAVNGLTPNALASRLGVSRRLLDLRFHEFSDESVAETILRHKLSSFHARLRQSSESIASLAKKCGFANVNSLRNQFSRQYGYSPKQARRP